ncbi:hypothetical protein ACFV9W_37715 [Streptomyces sp. NPDC059897]|uniref:hypothetical protein n=1 Tax=Streptomyces sp. NPDC059897 TaxID=3346994 RepID=UPI00365A5D33
MTQKPVNHNTVRIGRDSSSPVAAGENIHITVAQGIETSRTGSTSRDTADNSDASVRADRNAATDEPARRGAAVTHHRATAGDVGPSFPDATHITGTPPEPDPQSGRDDAADSVGTPPVHHQRRWKLGLITAVAVFAGLAGSLNDGSDVFTKVGALLGW